MIGELLGNYRIVGPLGRGGMASIFVGEHQVLGHRVAIKVLRDLHFHDPTSQQRLLNEARAVANIRHPSIVELHDFGYSDGGVAYMVMELLEGEDLRTRLRRGELTERHITTFGIQIAGALAAAHAHGVIHRDLKPSNIFLISDPESELRERAKLLDFGISKRVRSADRPVDDLTAAGMLIGTPAYMSPEQCEGGEIDERSDIYSFGVVTYRMATAQLPYEGKSDDTILSHIISAPTPPRDIRPELSSGLEAVILRCLAKEPKNRFQSMTEVATALAAAASGLPPVIGVATGTSAERAGTRSEPKRAAAPVAGGRGLPARPTGTAITPTSTRVLNPTATVKAAPATMPAPTPTPVPGAASRPIRTPTPPPVPNGGARPARTPTPAPVRTLTPAPVRTLTPAPVRTLTPAPVRTPTPAPVRTSTPAPVRTATPTPAPARSPMPPAVQTLTPPAVQTPPPRLAQGSAPRPARAPTPPPLHGAAPPRIPAASPNPRLAAPASPNSPRPNSPRPSPSPAPARPPAPRPAGTELAEPASRWRPRIIAAVIVGLAAVVTIWVARGGDDLDEVSSSQSSPPPPTRPELADTAPGPRAAPSGPSPAESPAPSDSTATPPVLVGEGIDRAERAMAAGDFAAALDSCAAILRDQPDDQPAGVICAIAACKLGELERGRTYAQQIRAPEAATRVAVACDEEQEQPPSTRASQRGKGPGRDDGRRSPTGKPNRGDPSTRRPPASFEDVEVPALD